MRFATLLLLLLPAAALAAPLEVPFDYGHHVIGLDVTVRGKPLYMMLDTGIDPSVIDTATADALGLKVDRSTSGEATGEGDAQHATVFGATIDGLAIKGHAFEPFDALASDMSTLSASYGRKLDGVLGYSFLNGRIVLVDYARTQITILDRPVDAGPTVNACRKRWSTPLHGFGDNTIPAIPDFRFGSARGNISLDTGSSGGIALFQSALDLPGVHDALKETGETTATGARGKTTMKTYQLNLPVGFGPFTLPAGQAVSLSKMQTQPNWSANIGNRLFAEMKLKLLLDYRDKVITFYGDCR